VWDTLLIVALVFLQILLFIPETMLVSENGMAGGSYLQKRIQPYPVYAVLLWLAAQSIGGQVKNATRMAAVIISLGLLALHTLNYQVTNRDIQEYLSVAPHIEAGSSLLPVHLRAGSVTEDGQPVSDYINVYWHLSNILGFSNELLVLDNFEATMGYFPLIFRADHMPYFMPTKIKDSEALLAAGPPKANALPKVQELGLKPDYVLVWLGRASGQGDDQTLYAWLDANYEQTFVSSERRYVELYRRKQGS